MSRIARVILLTLFVMIAVPAFVQSPAQAQTKAPAPPTTVTMPNGTTVSQIAASALSSKGALDLYMTLTNNRSDPDSLVGAQIPADKIVLVTVTGGKETETPVAVGLPTGKAVELEKSKQFLRVYGVDTKQFKSGEPFQLTLHFRSGPNVKISPVIGAGKSSSFFGFGQ
jgi:copper(I)-binding protein